jgi:tetratricopeptide (TPR) repeat protein
MRPVIRIRWFFHLFWLLLALPGFSGAPQSRPGRPALIRDTDAAEGKEEAEPDKPKEFSPVMAEKSIKVGDFYFKKGNYLAAIQRYRDATEYQPNNSKAYESLAKALEKNGDPLKAADVYREFIDKNPDSSKIPDFRSKLAKLEKK